MGTSHESSGSIIGILGTIPVYEIVVLHAHPKIAVMLLIYFNTIVSKVVFKSKADLETKTC